MLLAFDFINTIVDLKLVASDSELQAYADHLKDYKDTYIEYGREIAKKSYKPFNPPPHWILAPIFPEVKPALALLRRKGHHLVAFTNAPAWLTMLWINNNNLPFSCITPLEAYKVFKPTYEAYQILPFFYGIPAPHICVVTANRNFGDLEGAAKAGMYRQLINRDDTSGRGDLEPFPAETKDLLEFAQRLA